MTSSSAIEEVVVSTLRSLGITYELIQIDPEFADTTLFCEKYGYPLDHCGNAIVVASKREPKRFSACIVKGSDRLDVNKTVRRLMGVSRLSFTAPEETMDLTGMMIGGVTPFALPPEVPIYADDKLLGLEYIILGSGSRSSKLKLPPEDLRKIPNLEFVDGLSMGPRPQS